MTSTPSPEGRTTGVLERLASLETRQAGRSFEQLRPQVLSGNREAWTWLVEKYSRFVYAVTLKLLSGYEEREEAAGAIYTRVFERLAAREFALIRRFEGRCRFTTYLYRIVQSERKDYFSRRRTASRIETTGGEMPETAVDGAGTPPVSLLEPETLRNAARQALGRLEPVDRLLLLYRFRDGLKLREIAEVAGLKDTNAVAHALQRALSRLDLLKRFRDEHRLGEVEIETLGGELRRELLDGAVADGGMS